jgi:MarR family transcriptional regulator, lower aerobic nicotinate degradation pathway regulator
MTASTTPGAKRDESGLGDVDIVDALAELSFFVQGALAGHAAALELSMIQTRLLGVLRDREPTMQELARILELDKSSVTGLVDRAERRGLVLRTPSTVDRRTIRVALTASGRRHIRVVGAAFQRDIAAATASLSPADKKKLSSLARRVIEARPASPRAT